MKQPKVAAKKPGGASARTRAKRGTGKSVKHHHAAAAHHPLKPPAPAKPGGGGAGGGGKGGGGKSPAPAHHTPHRKAPAKKSAKRGLAIGSVACCAAEAVARSSQMPVEPSDVLALYRHVADSPDAGASIWRTLEAASGFGVAGIRPVNFQPVDTDDLAAVVLGLDLPGAHAVAVAECGCWWSWGRLHDPAEFPDAVIEEAWAVTWAT